MSLVLDTGAIYASLDRSDPDHEAVVGVLRTTPRPHVIVEPVLVEVDYWIRKLLDLPVLDALVTDIVAGRYEFVALANGDLERIVQIELQYADADLGFVDASIVAICERLDIGSV